MEQITSSSLVVQFKKTKVSAEEATHDDIIEAEERKSIIGDQLQLITNDACPFFSLGTVRAVETDLALKIVFLR